MKTRIFEPANPVSKGPFLLSEMTETPQGDLVLKLNDGKNQATMERVIMAVRTEIGLKLARRNGTEYRQAPFTYEYYPDTLSFIIKPTPGVLDMIKTNMSNLLLPEIPKNTSSECSR